MELGSKVVNARTKKVNVGRLQSIVHYMTVYDSCIDLQIYGMELMTYVLENVNGLGIIEEMSTKLHKHFDELVRLNVLVNEICQFWKSLNDKRSEVAAILGSFRSNSL